MSDETTPATTDADEVVASVAAVSDGAYTLFVADLTNSGPFKAILKNTKNTSLSFTGKNGHTYGFFSVATDNVYNYEPTPTMVKARTTVDASPPTSAVAALPVVSPGNFTVSLARLPEVKMDTVEEVARSTATHLPAETVAAVS